LANLINVKSKKNGKETPYSTAEDVGNLCRYVVGESGKHDASEILAYGAYGVTDDAGVQTMIDQIQIVQRYHRIDQRGGRRMAHLCQNITEEEFGRLGCNEELLTEYFSSSAQLIYGTGHQVVYGVHINPDNSNSEDGGEGKPHAFAHVHLGISSINFESGRKFHMTKQELRDTEAVMNEKLEEYKGRSAVRFSNADVWRERYR
jgi:hypothetical protein